MWVRLWAKAFCASGESSEEQSYEWYDKDHCDDYFEGAAQDFFSRTWIRDSDRFRYGFERIGNVLPDIVRAQLESRSRYIIEAEVERLRIILASVEPPTRFDRKSIK